MAHRHFVIVHFVTGHLVIFTMENKNVKLIFNSKYYEMRQLRNGVLRNGGEPVFYAQAL